MQTNYFLLLLHIKFPTGEPQEGFYFKTGNGVGLVPTKILLKMASSVLH